MKKNLYQIEQQYLELAEQLEDGEFTEDLEQKLSITQEELQTKAVKYAYVIKDFEYDTEAIDKEIKRLQALKKSKTNALDRMKQAISDAMILFGIEKIETSIMKLSFRASKSTIVDESRIPKKYLIKKVTYSPDKTAIKKDLESGKKIKGAELVTNKNLQIK